MRNLTINYQIFLSTILFFASLSLAATTFTSTTSGNWNDGATWGNTSPGVEGTDWPSATDDVIIQGHTVTLTADRAIVNVDINVGGTLDTDTRTLTINGNLDVNGTLSGDEHLEMFGVSIDGSGTISKFGKEFRINTDGVIIEAGSSLTFDCDFKFDVNDIDLTNFGNTTVTEEIKEQNGGNIWTNGVNATINVGGTFLANNQIDASASPNIVNYYGSAVQNIFTPLSNYHTLQTSGTGTKTIQGVLDINGDLIISESAILDVDAFNISVAGDWTNTSDAGDTFLEQSGAVTLDGNSTQTITATETFYDLVLNNSFSGDGVVVVGSITISNSLTLTDGQIVTDATNTFTLGSGASLSYSAGSFIAGPFTQNIASTSPTALDFPVGKDDVMHRATLTVTQDAITETSYTVEYFDAAPSVNTKPAGIERVSGLSNWDFDKGAGAGITAGQVTLYYLAYDEVTEASSLRIVKDDGAGNWVDLGGTGTGAPSGSITSTTNFTSFSEFTFAATSSENPLPVTLTDFHVELDDNQNALIYWSTNTEVNNDYFVIEKSADGKSFNDLQTVIGAGDSDSPKDYKVVDFDPYFGLTFYRLKQVDYDGTINFHEIISLQMQSVVEESFDVFPSPIIGELTIIPRGKLLANEPISLAIYDLSGRLRMKKMFQLQPGESLRLNIPNSLEVGIYSLIIKSSNSQESIKISLK